MSGLSHEFSNAQVGGLGNSNPHVKNDLVHVKQYAQNSVSTQTPAQQSKEFDTMSLLQIGKKTVQDIMSRTQEVLQTLEATQPPNGTLQGSIESNEKKAKVQQLLRTIRVLFKRLRLIYEKCNENYQLQEMGHAQIESLIPFKDEEVDSNHDKKNNSKKNQDVIDQVVLKNRQLKEVIGHLRRIIWEINTILTMAHDSFNF